MILLFFRKQLTSCIVHWIKSPANRRRSIQIYNLLSNNIFMNLNMVQVSVSSIRLRKLNLIIPYEKNHADITSICRKKHFKLGSIYIRNDINKLLTNFRIIEW